jgi:ribosomal protein L7Ae-like RNA K-turn-binding protein
MLATKRNGRAPKAEERRLPEQNTVALERAYRLLGLGVRARGVIVGVEQVRAAAKGNRLVLALVATDASPNSLKKVVPLLNARRVRFIEVSSAEELGRAVGREQTTVVGVLDRRLADGIRDLHLENTGSPRASREGV